MVDFLTRDAFREGVFTRDRHACVICRAPAIDAHHIIERRLWGPCGGYALENGASVCEACHLKAEQTLISCDELRRACGIMQVLLPEHLYPDQPYDKWGNPIQPNGSRLKGELFYDESVQKILAPVLHLFTDLVKYPRTWHLPWSPGVGKDDRVLTDLSAFAERRVVVTVKMDGENTSLYRDALHARSIDYAPHASRGWVRALHASVAHDIPDGWRVCGENLWAKHSIQYDHLRDYFLVFSIWNDKNFCLPWDETVEWAALLGLGTVPVLYDGAWNEARIRQLYTPEFEGDPCEGYVARITGGFHYKDFRKVVGKYVRQGHVVTHARWIHQHVEQNRKAS